MSPGGLRYPGGKPGDGTATKTILRGDGQARALSAERTAAFTLENKRDSKRREETIRLWNRLSANHDSDDHLDVSHTSIGTLAALKTSWPLLT
ncbi:hypothetical protein EYF80_024557 [Liparis tanakae]|uniref:Uncharacterized protein n=1 Tax=Liparis tanakae TaxID=230148 RepID=A0A4Z2HHD3_9TELE|nr:hypothetical protein EYF80_024557 [Liparis tanakae]